MGWPEHHAAWQLDSFRADLSDQERTVVKSVHRYGCCRLEIGERVNELAGVEQHPLISVFGLKFLLQPIERGDVSFEVCHLTTPSTHWTTAHAPWPDAATQKMARVGAADVNSS
jgi:hypothetical protein